MKTLIIIVFVLAFGALAKSADDDNDTQYITNGLKTRIMGGSDAQVGWFPWQVFIKIKKPFSWSYCGGSLIGSNWALTAAHCVDDALYYKIKVGGIGTTDINEEGSVVATTILRRKHWAYSSRNLNNDIALIKLLSPIPESDTILYLRLPRRSAGSFDGTRATVSGWGQTEHILYDYFSEYLRLCTYSSSISSDIVSLISKRFSPENSNMKVFVATALLALCLSVQGARYNNSPAITLKDLYASQKDGSRIISGESALFGQFPWQASVTIDGASFCGGSLISSRWVLTAAHCVSGGSRWTVKVGGIIRTGSESGSVTVTTSKAFAHRDYNPYLNNDIALIDLGQDLELSDNLRPVRLPSRSDVGNALENTKLTVSGWGKTSDFGGVSNTLQFVELDTITNQQCRDVYGPASIISSTLCCKGHPEHSTCNGDSGGPLVHYDADGEATQVGVVSFVHIAGCASGNPSGYVRTASFLDWVESNTGIAIRN